MLEKSKFDTRFKDADSIIGHAGMGTISWRLTKTNPFCYPRMCEYKEHVNDHQASTADMFENHGHVLVARNMDPASG